MRTVKDADERKTEILDAAGALFYQKGYDATTVSDIINKLGVARGLLYYHFKSKEDILDALLQRTANTFLAAANKIAEDKSIPVVERLVQTVMAMNARNEPAAALEELHKPQNALMHQKSHRIMMKGIPPVLAKILQDGIDEGLFDTPYPYETLETVVAHVNAVFDDAYISTLPQEEIFKRVHAFLFNLDRLFGAKPGSFAPLIRLFTPEKESGNVP